MFTSEDLELNTAVKVIMPLKDIPRGAYVTKITGTKIHFVKDEVRVYDKSGSETKLHSYMHNDGKFLLDPRGGNFEGHPADKEFVWHVQNYEIAVLISIVDDDSDFID